MSIFDGDAEQDAFADLSQQLVDAGYFRARISTLPKFDLLVGGLAWAITLINMEVDLSLDDQANLGQKIKLAEIICKVLERMKCPSPLMAHQIQGLDFPSVLPVMNWLLQKVVEVRAENEAATCVAPQRESPQAPPRGHTHTRRAHTHARMRLLCRGPRRMRRHSPPLTRVLSLRSGASTPR